MHYKLLVLEGLDCCGKTTVVDILSERLAPSTVVSFPHRSTELGTILDRYLKKEPGVCRDDHELHLLFSANRYEMSSHMKTRLEQGNVICDRYWMSGAVYSAAKGLDYEWCKQVDKYLPAPDHMFFIDVDPDVVTRRKGFGEEAHDKVDFQRKVYSIYKQRAQEEGLIIIDGNRSPGEIADDIVQYLR